MNYRRQIINIFILVIIKIFINYFLGEEKDFLFKGVVCIITTLIIQICINGKILKLTSIFLILSYIFNISYVILNYLNYDFKEMSYGNPLNNYSISLYNETINLILSSLLFIQIGFILKNIFFKYSYTIKEKNFFRYYSKKLEKENILKKIIVILFSFSFLADLYILYLRIAGMNNYGYSGVYDIKINFLFNIIQKLLLPSILIIVYRKRSKVGGKIILLSYIVYKIFSTGTGLRGYVAVELIIILIFYNNFIRKISKKYIIYVGILGYFILSWFIVVRQNRSLGLKYEDIITIFLNKDIVLYSMAEFGVTINVVLMTVKNVNKFLGDYGIGGKQTIIMLSGWIPYISKLFPALYNLNIYEAFNFYRWGGSYIADFYYDLGKLYFISCIFYGIVIAKVEEMLIRSIKEKKIWKLYIFIPCIVEILFSVRSSTYKIIRPLFYTLGLFFVISLLIIFIFEVFEKENKKNAENKILWK